VSFSVNLLVLRNRHLHELIGLDGSSARLTDCVAVSPQVFGAF